jgi:hypothetical protein
MVLYLFFLYCYRTQKSSAAFGRAAIQQILSGMR